MNKYTLVLLSVTAGIISGLAWTEWCTGMILMAGLTPFFIIENYLFRNRSGYHDNAFFIFLLPGLIVFCMIALGWVRVATTVGAIFIITGLAFMMAFTMWLAHWIRLKGGIIPGLISMFSFWLTFEYICLNSDVLTPWLNLGNGLAKEPVLIQWYEVTGVAGGSLWILASNLCLATVLIRWLHDKKLSAKYLIIWILILTVPSALSVRRYHNIRSSDNPGHEVVIIQPNYDPYSEKFSIPFEIQLKQVLIMGKTASTDRTEWILTPETTVDDPVDEDSIQRNKYIRMIKEYLKNHPGAAFITGMVSFREIESDSDKKETQKNINRKPESNFEHYNSAIEIDTGKVISVYHKSKLVPGIEKQFSSFAGNLITKILPYFGGTKWGYGTQPDRICFEHHLNSFRAAPVICYESVFGKHVTDYVRNGANAIFIITNDGWWRYTNGYKQHLWYASLRAIETRRPVARAANTGISCFIDLRGDITMKTAWWQPAVIRGLIRPETQITPYVRYGDYLMQSASVSSAVIILFFFVSLPFIKRIKHVRLQRRE